MAWSINCRLMVAQLTLALVIVYLYNINKMMQLDRLHARHSQSDHLPHPVHPRPVVDEDGDQLHPTSRTARSREFSRSQHAAESDVVRCRDTRKPNAAVNADWQREDHPSGTIYVYSAAYHGRSVKRDPDSVTVRLLVLASGIEDRSTVVYCQLWYAEVSEPAVVRAGLTELDAEAGRRTIGQQIYVQYLISCVLERSGANVENVSLVVGDRCKSASALVPILSPSAATEMTEVGICAMMAWPLSDESIQKPLQSAPWFIEWLELQLTVFGASRVFLYVAFDDDLWPLKQLIRLYANRKKSLVIRRIRHPVDGRKRQRRDVIGNLRALAVNDCLLRNSRQFRYLIDVDVDELIVPRHVALNYSEMVTRIDTVVNKLPQRSSAPPSIYYFHVVSFILDVSADETNALPRLTTTGYFRTRDRPQKGVRRAMIDATRCVVVTPSTGCDVEVMAGVATSVEVPLNVAGCHRYHRACQPEVGCETAPRLVAAPIKDNTMLRFQQRLKFPVIQALRDSGSVNNAGLYQVALNA